MEHIREYLANKVTPFDINVNTESFFINTIFESIEKVKAIICAEILQLKQMLEPFHARQQFESARINLINGFRSVFAFNFMTITEFDKFFNKFRKTKAYLPTEGEDRKLMNQIELKETYERSCVSSTMFTNNRISRTTEDLSKRLKYYLENGLQFKKTELLSNLLLNVFQKQRQSEAVYKLKAELRQKIYTLLKGSMSERIDLYLIGSSSTGLGSNASDTDLCLVIYDSEGFIDKKYDEKSNSILKLHEISGILQMNGISINLQVIPALVPILKFSEKSSGIEVNINLNRLVTIRNTHLLHTYSQIDWRVAPLVLTVKLWARKYGINCAFNKSLTSYSISLMVIYYLQSVCDPPVIPCLQKDYPQLFSCDVTELRLGNASKIRFNTKNDQSLGQLFTNFIEYFSLHFPYDKVISVRSGSIMDRSLFMGTNVNSGKLWQWKCHICIEEPFDKTNTSHSVHDCQVFRHILYAFMETLQVIKNGKMTTDLFI